MTYFKAFPTFCIDTVVSQHYKRLTSDLEKPT